MPPQDVPSEVLPERGPAAGSAATASGAQASCLQSHWFHWLRPSRPGYYAWVETAEFNFEDVGEWQEGLAPNYTEWELLQGTRRRATANRALAQRLKLEAPRQRQRQRPTAGAPRPESDALDAEDLSAARQAARKLRASAGGLVAERRRLSEASEASEESGSGVGPTVASPEGNCLTCATIAGEVEFEMLQGFKSAHGSNHSFRPNERPLPERAPRFLPLYSQPTCTARPAVACPAGTRSSPSTRM